MNLLRLLNGWNFRLCRSRFLLFLVDRTGPRTTIWGVTAALIATTLAASRLVAVDGSRELAANEISDEFRSFTAKADASGTWTWWLPPKPDALVLPISAGTLVETSNESLMRWLKEGSPWGLSELPLIGARYGERTAVVIVPWPHYAELVVEERIGIRFKFPAGRANTTRCEIVVCRRGMEPLQVAQSFRNWRESATDTGAIPRPRPLSVKAVQLPEVARLFGAPHFYLWVQPCSAGTTSSAVAGGRSRERCGMVRPVSFPAVWLLGSAPNSNTV